MYRTANISCEEDNDSRLQPLCTNDGRQSHRNFVLSLLAQQWEHQQLGIHDPKGLFQYSKTCTKSSRQRALEKGKENAKEVERIMKENLESVIDSALDLLQYDDI